MQLTRQFSLFKVLSLSLISGLLLISYSSCVTPGKIYPKDKPFVFKTNISVTGELDGPERQELVAGLENQLDDSLKVRIISYAGVYRKLIKPAIFDTANISRSKVFMEALLTSQGFFYPTIKDTFLIDTFKLERLAGKHKGEVQQRVTVNFQVNTGKRTLIDSIGYDLETPALQSLAIGSKDESALRKRQPFSVGDIATERDRLLQVFHNNGYYKVSGDDIYAEKDTVLAALIDPNLDPFEQIRLLDSLTRKRDKPTITIVFKQRVRADTSNLRQFYIGRVRIFPDQYYLQDTLSNLMLDSLKYGSYEIFSNSQKFRIPFLTRNTFLKPGTLYSERNYFRTINTFNRLGAWQNVELTLKERYDSVPRLDADIKLYPSTKLATKIDLEASRNIADYLTTSQLFGVGLNFSITNRNAFRESIQSSTNARFGIELGSNFIQTLQSNLSHSIYFPRLILPFKIKDKKEQILNARTVFNIAGTYTIRRQIYNVNSINSSWTYEFSRRSRRPGRQTSFQVTIPNVEYTLLRGKDSLNQLIKQIPSLQYAFNDGFVIGSVGAMNTTWNRKNRISNFKLRIEQSGALFGLIKNLERNNLFRFVKTDVEFKSQINYKYSGWAFRTFAGYGYVYGRKGDQPENKLPFFKAYFAGGPYSMRAWQVRRLGPGSSQLYDTAGLGSNDRFGNMQLEANVEYRFNLTTIAGIKVKSALFLDIGNVWGIEFSDAAGTKKIPEASFKFSRLYKDIAIGGGTSLRFDFDFFLIRLDWAYQLKNPSFAKINDGWFHDLRLLNGQFQLGIGYPF